MLDLGTVIAGAHAGGVLANLGADVIKIEPIEGDPFRSNGGGFMAYSRGKRGLGIDLKQPAAREMFFDLVRGADVILDNYRFGVRERLGIHYAALKAINPRIVSCSINAYGDKGARAVLPGFDPLLQAEGGMMAAQGGRGSRSCTPSRSTTSPPPAWWPSPSSPPSTPVSGPGGAGDLHQPDGPEPHLPAGRGHHL
uniref:CoA transferase n=1 Tax=Phenylobacterium glaciei TaxID=2803784 RepID=A0A974P0W9_9CAUL|nr:CoA transferase [Phenylobacterium glaciei]